MHDDSAFSRWVRADSAMFFRRYDRRARYFDHVFSWLIDTGLTDYFLEHSMPYMDVKEQIEVTEEKLVLEHFFLPMVFGATGVFAGAVALVIEYMVYHKFIKSWKRRNVLEPGRE